MYLHMHIDQNLMCACLVQMPKRSGSHFAEEPTRKSRRLADLAPEDAPVQPQQVCEHTCYVYIYLLWYIYLLCVVYKYTTYILTSVCCAFRRRQDYNAWKR
eukprot:GHVS01073894.1.p3 GENE.GHVS01073894.1~~GHVS01073894.1.p3  ORF type:complete len:101 (+),score=5.66 GHVS01073894.1:188-490(+)